MTEKDRDDQSAQIGKPAFSRGQTHKSRELRLVTVQYDRIF